MTTGLVTTTRGRIVPLQNMTKRSRQISITPTLSGWTSQFGYAYFYADSNNVWRVNFHICMSKDTGTTTGAVTTTMPGMTFLNVPSGTYQALAGTLVESGVSSKPCTQARTGSGDSTVWLTNTGSEVYNKFMVWGDAILNAEPTWTSLGTTWAAIAETVGDVTAYIPPCAAATSGIINNDPTNTAGNLVLGRTSGVAVPAGYVGQTFSANGTYAEVGTAWANMGSLNIGAGCFQAALSVSRSTGTGNGYIIIALITSATPGSGTYGLNTIYLVKTSGVAGGSVIYLVNSNSNTTLYAHLYGGEAANTISWGIQAVRIA